jgi:hypothetical protein
MLGLTGGDAVKLGSENVDLKWLREIHESWLPEYMEG